MSEERKVYFNIKSTQITILSTRTHQTHLITTCQVCLLGGPPGIGGSFEFKITRHVMNNSRTLLNTINNLLNKTAAEKHEIDNYCEMGSAPGLKIITIGITQLII